MFHQRQLHWALMGLFVMVFAGSAIAQNKKVKPLMKDFMGLNVHTINFKPELYAPVCAMVRDYHNLDWDVGDNAGTPTQFPKGEASKANWLDWGQMYGSWVKSGFNVDVCVQWQTRTLPPEKWPNMPKNAYDYGKAFATYFGSRGQNIVKSIEIGNEPGTHYPSDAYDVIFENMAKGVRAGDPTMKILTAAADVEGNSWAKPLDPFKKFRKLFDVINVHQYALKTGYPTWERSYPEDMSIKYVSVVQDVIDWRNRNMPEKQVWLTEFGYDASTKPAPSSGDFSRWMDVSDEKQAQYIVRSFLVFSAMDVDRAYLYYFNDSDEPEFHGSSGITRNYEPKPSYYAVRQLFQTLGNYRFVKAIQPEKGKLFVYEYVKGSNARDRIFVAWSPTDSDEASEQFVALPGRPASAVRMVMKDGAPEPVDLKEYRGGKLKLSMDGSPVYIHVK